MKKQTLFLTLSVVAFKTVLPVTYGPGPVIPQNSAYFIQEPVTFGTNTITIDTIDGSRPIVMKEDLSGPELRALITNLKSLLGIPNASLVRLSGTLQKIDQQIVNEYNQLRSINKPEADYFVIRTLADFIKKADSKLTKAKKTASSILANKPKNIHFTLTMENQASLQGLLNSLMSLLHGSMGLTRLEGTAAQLYNWIKTEHNKAVNRAFAQDFLILALAELINKNQELLLGAEMMPLKKSTTKPAESKKSSTILPIRTEPVMIKNNQNIMPVKPIRTTQVTIKNTQLIPLKSATQPVLIK